MFLGSDLFHVPVHYIIYVHNVCLQGAVLAGLNRRRAVITNTDALEGYFTIYAEVYELHAVI